MDHDPYLYKLLSFAFQTSPSTAYQYFQSYSEKCFKAALQSNSTSNSVILQITYLSVPTAGSWGAEGHLERGTYSVRRGIFHDKRKNPTKPNPKKEKKKNLPSKASSESSEFCTHIAPR